MAKSSFLIAFLCPVVVGCAHELAPIALDPAIASTAISVKEADAMREWPAGERILVYGVLGPRLYQTGYVTFEATQSNALAVPEGRPNSSPCVFEYGNAIYLESKDRIAQPRGETHPAIVSGAPARGSFQQVYPSPSETIVLSYDDAMILKDVEVLAFAPDIACAPPQQSPQ